MTYVLPLSYPNLSFLALFLRPTVLKAAISTSKSSSPELLMRTLRRLWESGTDHFIADIKTWQEGREWNLSLTYKTSKQIGHTHTETQDSKIYPGYFCSFWLWLFSILFIFFSAHGKISIHIFSGTEYTIYNSVDPCNCKRPAIMN